ncbi:ABC transporter ATP-binding protein [Candidatus Roseilinea sp. NK_OTU-006]|jgi:ABC-type multidrug transport system fused ATPase/permease subunit|uniref:ABC transporter ATP-binding protein n=1 Tax=Candidatus Roseilinea sp. NK_OTU-006 TaxID=2704250 RepID=UPI00145E647F|nr:ABC transporter ATP-binding protein [Candidatus Roseilinea sp. NK_OTU-006]
MLRLLAFLKPHRKLVIALVLVNFFLSAMLTVAPLVIKAIVDDVIGAQRLELLLPYLALLLLVTGARAAATYFYSYGQNKLGQLVMTDVRAALYRKLLVLPYSFYDKEQTGRLMSRVSSDVESTRIFLSQILVESLNHAMTIVLATVALFEQSVILALLAAGPMVASGLAMYAAHRRLSEPWALQHQRFAKMSATLQDSLAGVKVVKAFAQEAQEEHKFMATVAEVRAGSLRINDLWNRRWAVIGSIGRFMQLLMIGVGGYMVMAGSLSLGALVAAISLSLLLLGAVNALGTQLNAFSQTATASVRIFELLDEPVTIRSPARPQRLSGELRGEIEFEQVSFRYPTSRANTLRDINLRIPAGSSLAVVGATGSGKSTLVHLIGRFYDPRAGRVLVDGHDVRTLDLADLRRQIGMVAQDALLFSASIAENIAFGRPDAPREAIERAAKLAQAHDFIVQLPDGYDTKIGERGIGLSGGQRQRIAIARAILLDPRILILDDSMSAVDAETEKLLQAAIRTVMRGRTTILIAHRLSTVEQADRIIVLREGRIVEQGTHAELARSSGYYRHVLEMQRMSAAETMSETLPTAPQTVGIC